MPPPLLYLYERGGAMAIAILVSAGGEDVVDRVDAVLPCRLIPEQSGMAWNVLLKPIAKAINVTQK